jgi:hypothetical protein
VHLPMVYRGCLLIGDNFDVLLKVLLWDHVDRGDELAVVVVGTDRDLMAVCLGCT